MAKRPSLKVYRMPIGFHDAYVAAPTKKAAIEAWGANEDVFRRGVAELVEDAALKKKPLQCPGEVVKRLRGTPAEQLAALGEGGDEPKSEERRAAKPQKLKPMPSRAPLEKIEEALSETTAEHDRQLETIAKREAALARERETLKVKQAKERANLEARLEKAESAYKEKVRRWRKS